jgi:hypothetical protein
MEKEMSIYNALVQVIGQENDLKSKLTLISDYLFEKYDLKSYFCEIKGKRWSHFAGKNEVIYVSQHFVLNDKIGIITEQPSIEDDFIIELIKDLRKIIVIY